MANKLLDDERVEEAEERIRRAEWLLRSVVSIAGNGKPDPLLADLDDRVIRLIDAVRAALAYRVKAAHKASR